MHIACLFVADDGLGAWFIQGQEVLDSLQCSPRSMRKLNFQRAGLFCVVPQPLNDHEGSFLIQIPRVTVPLEEK